MNINLPAGALYNIDLNVTGNFKTSLPNGLLVENIVFEVTESESLTDESILLKNLRLLKDFGFKTAIDDFGVGYSGLKLLMEYQPNFVKLDRYMISDIHENKIKQVIFLGVQEMCEDLSIEVVAEGVENEEEYFWLERQGVRLFQGYYFAKPAFEALPAVIFSNSGVDTSLNTAF
ncbi:MAG: EAL domain-containing protein [Anaerolineales bacterium]|nr:EAL domain-containing protein [Anaerolineales bacterium]